MSISEKIPKATVVAYIFNKDGELFLMPASKWQGKLVPPGGHIEYGETADVAIKREVKEETNLDIKNIRLLTYIDMIEPAEFHRPDHFVGLEMRAELDGEDQEVVLEDREAKDYIWQKPEEIITRNDVEAYTKKVIENYLVNKVSCPNCQEYKTGWQRAQADYQNLVKEMDVKRKNWAMMSEIQILEEFIPIYDNFKKAFAVKQETGTKEQENWAKGIEFIMKQFEKVLKDHEIQEIKTVGEMFNPQLHEAVGDEIGSGEADNVIVKEIESGYKKATRVIKVAKVIVSKKV